VRYFIFCVAVSFSSPGCIYASMEDSTSESESQCSALLNAVCTDCSEEMCDEYEGTLDRGTFSESQCSALFDSLARTGC